MNEGEDSSRDGIACGGRAEISSLCHADRGCASEAGARGLGFGGGALNDEDCCYVSLDCAHDEPDSSCEGRSCGRGELGCGREELDYDRDEQRHGCARAE